MSPTVASSAEVDGADVLKRVRAAVGDDVEFVERVLAENELPEDEVAALRARLDLVGARCADDDLYLAVVGEFSSGKTTFLNALLDEPPLFDEPLLETSVKVTTGAITELRRASELKLEVRFSDADEWCVYTGETGGLAAELSARLPEHDRPSDLPAALRMVTSDERLTGAIETVRLHHPDPLLGEHIVIVDTPGINAGRRFERHAGVTARAVERADVAVVFIPSNQPLSMTLVEFLRGPLEPFLHRCVFVLTRMRYLESDAERDRVREWVGATLETELRIEKPVVYAASVGVVVDYLRAPDSVPEPELRWVTGFRELEADLRERVQRSRALSIAESVLRLLELLLEDLDSRLDARWADLQRQKEVLDEARIRDLDTFVGEQRQARTAELKASTRRARSKYRSLVRGMAKETTATVQARIDTAPDKAALRAVVEGVDGELAVCVKGLGTGIAAIGKELRKTTAQMAAAVDEAFEEEYRKLSRLDVAKRRAGVRRPKPGELGVGALDSVVELQTELDKKDENRETGLIATGAVIGTILFPGVGTVVGGILGGALSEWFGPPVAELRTRYWDKLGPGLQRQFEAAETAGLKFVGATEREATDAIDTRIESYVEHYKMTIARIVRRQAKRERELEALVAATDANREEIAKRRAELARWRDEIRTMGDAPRTKSRARPRRQRKRPAPAG